MSEVAASQTTKHNVAVRAAVEVLNAALREAHDAEFEVNLLLIFSGGPYKQVDASVAPMSEFAKELNRVR